MTREAFIKRLEAQVLLCDGAMGTMLSLQGIGIPYESANLTHPDLVQQVHRDYYEAGARLIETNTYGGNRLKLLAALERGNRESKIGNWEKQGSGVRDQGSEKPDPASRISPLDHADPLIHQFVDEVNRAAVRLARDAVGEDALILGAVGPVGKPLEPMGPTRLEEARHAFEEQIQILVEAGVDGFMLETFTDLNELRVALEVARQFAPDLPIIASKAFVEDGESINEGLPERIAREMDAWDADAIGANCVVGPQRMLDVVRNLRLGTDKPILAMPTPGLPQRSRGQIIYDIQPDYFAKYALRLVEAGAQIIGGCCGTTPDHVRAIRQSLNVYPPRHPMVRARSETGVQKQADELPSAEPSRFSSLLGKERVITVELDLPRGLNVSKILDNAALLKEHGVHVIDISDGARARLRMNVIAISHLIQQRAGIEVMMHFACRDRNLLAIQADLLGAHALGIRNILAITGDPTMIGDYPTATSVFDIDAVGLVRILRRFNVGYDLAGNTIGMKTNFTIAAAFNPFARDQDTELTRLKRKIEEGAHLFYTQPIFEPKVAEWTAEVMSQYKMPWLLGVLPLRNARHAEFMHNEVPGIVIPEWIRQRLAETPEEDSLKVGIEIAQRFLHECATCAQGVYLMPPAGNPKIALEVLGRDVEKARGEMKG